eukprot:UC4_evm1s270
MGCAASSEENTSATDKEKDYHAFASKVSKKTGLDDGRSSSFSPSGKKTSLTKLKERQTFGIDKESVDNLTEQDRLEALEMVKCGSHTIEQAQALVLSRKRGSSNSSGSLTLGKKDITALSDHQ